MSIAMAIMTCIFEFYIDPILGIQYTNLGVPVVNVGYAFALLGGMFGLGSYFGGQLCHVLNRKYVMQIGLTLTGLSILMIGPSEFLGLQPSVTQILIGMAGVGFSTAVVWTVIHPEITEGVESDQSSKDKNFVSTDMIADKVSAIYNMTFAMGSILGPIIGGGLYDRLGF